MIVRDYMKKRVISINENENLGTAAQKFVQHHVGMLPVVNGVGQLVGVLQLRDLLSLFLPVFTKLMEDIDFVGDFGAMESIQPSEEVLIKKVSDVMEEPFCVEDFCGLSRAFALLHKHQLNELPVVDEGKHLVGSASRVDIGTGLLKNWRIISSE